MERKNNKGTYKPNTAMDEDTFRQKFSTEKAARKYGNYPQCSAEG
jgi:hypothetical protein